jgi:Cdc6-like AAA superfamily ATPase
MKFPEPPFNMLISGITGCGKTHMVLDLLEVEYRKQFDYVIIICPTFPSNKTYHRKFILNDVDVFPIVINDKLNEILDVVLKKFGDSREQTLIIIDDCANLYDAKLKATALTKLAFHGRHLNLSTWVITQKYNAIVKDFRENIRVLIMFYDKDKESRNAAFKENDIGITLSEKETIVKKLKNDINSKLVMQLFPPFAYEVL